MSAPTRPGALSRSAFWIGASLLFAAAAVAFTWPLAARLDVSIAGPRGDSVLGVWNIWYFRRALDLGRNPFWNEMLYWPYGSNLLLHHLTLTNDLAAAPLLPRLGLYATYNLLYLASLTLAGLFAALLAREEGLGEAAALWTGLMFAFGPWTDFSAFVGAGIDYIGIHVIPFFAWAILRLKRRGGPIDALLAAAALTWVWTQNYYYFLMCALMIPAVYLLDRRPLTIRLGRVRAPRTLARALDAAAAAALLFAFARAWRGQQLFHGGGSARAIAAQVLPFLIAWALVGARLALSWRPKISADARAPSDGTWKPYAGAAAAWAAVNLPLVAATVYFIVSGDYGTSPKPWRGGGNPTDLLWLIAPNRLNGLWGPLWPASWRPEAELGSAGLALLALTAWTWRREKPEGRPRVWLGLGVLYFLLTLGPWLKLGGIQTYLPLPFYFLHLLPVYNNLQVGHKFLPFAGLFFALVSAWGLEKFWTHGRRAAAIAAALLVLIESAPPRPFPLQHVDPSPVLVRLADRPDGGVLPLPFGAIFTGIMGQGAVGEYWLGIDQQPVFRHPMMGGYLSRVPRRLFDLTIGDPLLAPLMKEQRSEPASIPGSIAEHLQRLKIAYVLVDEKLASPALKAEIARWKLTRLDSDGELTLYAALSARSRG